MLFLLSFVTPQREAVEADARVRRAADGAAADEQRWELFQTLSADQSRALQGQLDALKTEVARQAQALARAQAAHARVEDETRRREAEAEAACRQARLDADAATQRQRDAEAAANAARADAASLAARRRAAAEETEGAAREQQRVRPCLLSRPGDAMTETKCIHPALSPWPAPSLAPLPR